MHVKLIKSSGAYNYSETGSGNTIQIGSVPLLQHVNVQELTGVFSCVTGDSWLQSLCCGFPDNDQLSQLRDNLSSFQELRWDHYWKLHVLPLVTE